MTLPGKVSFGKNILRDWNPMIILTSVHWHLWEGQCEWCHCDQTSRCPSWPIQWSSHHWQPLRKLRKLLYYLDFLITKFNAKEFKFFRLSGAPALRTFTDRPRCIVIRWTYKKTCSGKQENLNFLSFSNEKLHLTRFDKIISKISFLDRLEFKKLHMISHVHKNSNATLQLFSKMFWFYYDDLCIMQQILRINKLWTTNY